MFKKHAVAAGDKNQNVACACTREEALATFMIKPLRWKQYAYRWMLCCNDTIICIRVILPYYIKLKKIVNAWRLAQK